LSALGESDKKFLGIRFTFHWGVRKLATLMDFKGIY